VPTAGIFVLSLLAAAPAERWGWLEDSGRRIRYGVAGRGVPILLIHGGLVDSRMWDDQVASLAPAHCTIRYDQRGFGRSSPPRAAYSPVEDARALLDKIRVSKAVVIGLSYGGQVAIDFALEHPDRVLALITAGATARGSGLRHCPGPAGRAGEDAADADRERDGMGAPADGPGALALPCPLRPPG
jgi:pimeloyl-ACP methyl ester carboxylesterase